jgi:hypothetical protein
VGTDNLPATTTPTPTVAPTTTRALAPARTRLQARSRGGGNWMGVGMIERLRMSVGDVQTNRTQGGWQDLKIRKELKL